MSSTAGRDILPALIGATAPLESALVETDMRMLASEVLRRSRQRCLVVLFTTLDAAPLAEGLLPVLPMLTARHQVVLASVADPALDRAGLAAGRCGAGVRRRGGRAGLGRTAPDGHAAAPSGCDVVDAPPDSFASTVADSYLAFKAAGRL